MFVEFGFEKCGKSSFFGINIGVVQPSKLIDLLSKSLAMKY
jgi:hypothetical protein